MVHATKKKGGKGGGKKGKKREVVGDRAGINKSNFREPLHSIIKNGVPYRNNAYGQHHIQKGQSQPVEKAKRKKIWSSERTE